MNASNPTTALQRHAELTLWSQPSANMQYQLSVKRISPDLGYIDTFVYMGRNRFVPKRGTYFHVLTLGGVNTGYWNFQSIINNNDPVDKWRNLADISRLRGVKLNIHTDKGLMIPLEQCWVMTTYDGVNLLAIYQMSSFPIKADSVISVQCYTVNSDVYHGDVEGNAPYQFLYKSAVFQTQETLNDLQRTLNSWKTLPGVTLIYVDGLLWTRLPNRDEITSSMVVEIQQDPTVELIEYYDVKNLPEFYSNLDKRRKLIVHPPKVTGKDEFKFRYFSDSDMFLVDGKLKGVFYDRNDVSNVRQLTHRDLSISGDKVNSMITHYSQFLNKGNAKLMVLHRKNAWTHTLPWEANAIKYLYRMDDQLIYQAMTDKESTVPEWTADALESSMTMQLNRYRYEQFNQDDNAKAFGYNAMTLLQSNSPVLPDTDKANDFHVPVSAQGISLVLEYDNEGNFIGTGVNTSSSIYHSDKANIGMVEFIPGKPGITINSIIGDTPVQLLRDWGWLAYKAGRLMPGDKPNDKWVLAEEGKDYTVKDGVLTWKYNKSQEIGCVVFNDQVILREFTLNHLDKTLSFDITQQWVGGGYALPFAPANILIMVNERSLIEDVDYILNYPNVQIINKQYLRDDGNNFTVVCYGWSPKVNTPVREQELGYVAGGVIGVNGRYNVRDNRVVRVVIDGKLRNLKDLKCFELNDADDFTNKLNGFPYSVRHLYHPVKGARDYDTNYLYVESRRTDKHVSDYLTKYLQRPTDGLFVNQQDKYNVFSPFMSKVSHDIKLGLLKIKSLAEGEQYSRQYLQDTLKPYLWMLEFDPVVLRFDERYFNVQPLSTFEIMAVKPHEFVFLSKVNDTYLESRCHMENYYEVKHV